ncbi:MAG: SRPBCC family protein [Bacteroidota bacterium]
MKKFGLLVLLFAVQFAIAQNGSKSFTASILATQSEEKAWEVITEVSQWKKWDKMVIDTKFDKDFNEKTTGVMIRPGGQINEFKIVAVDPGKSYTFSHKLSSGMLYVRRTVAPADSGSKITEEVWFKGISKKTFEKYYGQDFAQKLQNNLERLKGLLES